MGYIVAAEMWADESKELEAHIHLPEYSGWSRQVCMNEFMQQGFVGRVAIPAAKAEFRGRNRPNKVQGWWWQMEETNK